MRTIKPLSPTTETWLRRMIPAFAELRDRAQAAGLIDSPQPDRKQDGEREEADIIGG